MRRVPSGPPAGFTLVELMIVVAVLTVLASLSMVAYSRFFARGRVSEVARMFGEIRMREEAYRQEFSNYRSTVAAGQTEEDVYPPLVAGSEPTAKPWGTPPQGWLDLGASAPQQVYCGYVVIAGPANGWGLAGQATAGAFVQTYFNNVPPTGAWWAAVAKCDNDNDPSAALDDGKDATFITSSLSAVIVDRNPLR